MPSIVVHSVLELISELLKNCNFNDMEGGGKNG